MIDNSATITERIPDPKQIRTRLSDLTAEANLLRCLLRLLERRECGRQVLRQRRERQEVYHAS